MLYVLRHTERCKVIPADDRLTKELRSPSVHTAVHLRTTDSGSVRPKVQRTRESHDFLRIDIDDAVHPQSFRGEEPPCGAAHQPLSASVLKPTATPRTSLLCKGLD